MFCWREGRHLQGKALPLDSAEECDTADLTLPGNANHAPGFSMFPLMQLSLVFWLSGFSAAKWPLNLKALSPSSTLDL